MAVTTPERAIELVKKNHIHRVTFLRNAKGGVAYLWDDAGKSTRLFFSPGGLTQFMTDLPKHLDVTFERAGRG